MRFKYAKCLFLIFFVTLFSTDTFATGIFMPPVKVKSGEIIKLPVMIDAVDNLAGVKIVMTYDPKVLVYKGAKKTRYTSSLMHIVNGKNPGTLIIVMAAARGIKGKNFPLINLYFKANESLSKDVVTQVKIKESQLMGDDLKNLSHSVKNNMVSIIYSPSEKKKFIEKEDDKLKKIVKKNDHQPTNHTEEPVEEKNKPDEKNKTGKLPAASSGTAKADK